MSEKRNFKGVWIPADLWLDNDLTILQKALLVEIESLDNGEGCWKSNSTFADFFNCGTATITRAVKDLKKLGYINTSRKITESGEIRVINLIRPLIKTIRPGQSKRLGPANQNDQEGIPYRETPIEDNKNNKKFEEAFEKFRKEYPGTKRGLSTEFQNFKKKHKDWKKVVFELHGLLVCQKNQKELARKSGLFVPQWKNLQTYINQRCWEEEFNQPELFNSSPSEDDNEVIEL
ncbi:MAG: helix-turn-helix domain-containing protein [Lentisphaeraceae bacterium]|nr:helix-turn-helix domain-containing protein [Lentisphaeraceae bacterium]